MNRLWRLLRSRKAAIVALLAVVAYAAVATIRSDGDWAAPYGSPVFLLISGFLALSTGVCAWERTRVAIAALRRRPPSAGTIARLREAPQLVLGASAASDTPEAVMRALRTLGLRVRRYDDVLEGRGGIAGAIGSPLFHWSLALLFVAVVLGQLTRSEGLMGVMADSQKPDAEESYGLLESGPFAELTGRIIAVGEIRSSYTANGVDRGITPYVEILSPDRASVLASGYAYPNHPIRYRSMLVHISDDGLAALVEVTGAGGTLTDELLLDYDAQRQRVEPAVFGVTGPANDVLATVALEPAAGSTPEAPTVRVRSSAGDDAPIENPELDEIVPEGGTVGLPGDLTLRIVRLDKYARLSVVNDWSVYPIYALFGLAIVGLALALFAPPKAVRVLVVDSGGESRLHVVMRHSRGDPHFPERVTRAFERVSGMERE